MSLRAVPDPPARDGQDADGVVVGIDLGTTHSLVAVVERGTPRVLTARDGEMLVPSVVSLLDGEVLVGEAARARRTTHPELTAASFKCDMGGERLYRLDDQELSPPALSALVLRHLREEAEQILDKKIVDAVVTVPAYFDDVQRRATREAARLAELPVERLLNEPTAAAIAYGLHEIEREQRAVVLDLGGGTFDVTVLEIIEGVIEVQSSAGDPRLGGDDFTEALAELARRRAPDDLDPVSAARLLESCETAKRLLSRESTAPIHVPKLRGRRGRERDLTMRVSGEDALAQWRPLLERMRAPIRRALRDARLSVEDIDEVILVGGATRMPCVRDLAEEIFGRTPRCDLPPDETVALGAALQAALKAGDAGVEDLVVTDVAPFTLGIDTGMRVYDRLVTGVFSPILERGTVIPASRVRRYSTLEDNQREILIHIYQGEHAQCSDNRRLGEVQIDGIPPGAADSQHVDVRFTYDLNGILEVDVEVVSTGLKKNLVLENTPGRLAPEELEAARTALARLKFHPRDALPNTTALARGEALFQELTGPVRELLGEQLAGFRAVLDDQNAQEIDAAREALNALVKNLRTI